MRADHDLAKLGPAVRGKYYRKALGSSNLVLIEPDLMWVFPTDDAVNQALRMLAETAGAAVKKRTSRRAKARRTVD